LRFVDYYDVNIANLLLEWGADVNAKDIFGSTAIHYASFIGNTEVVKALIASGVNKIIMEIQLGIWLLEEVTWIF